MRKIATNLLLCLLIAAAAVQASAAGSGRSQLHDIFALLVKGNYTQATARYLDLADWLSGKSATETRELYPLPDLAEAMILSRPDDTGSALIATDPWRAMTLVRNAFVRGEGLAEANAFLGDDQIGLSTDVIHNMVEQRLVDYTKRQDNAEGYERLMTVIDSSNPAYNEAKSRMAELEFDRLCTSASGCKAFLRDYADSPLVGRAQQLQAKYDFEDAQKQGTTAAWDHYISAYRYAPNASSYVQQATALRTKTQNSELVNASVTLEQLDGYASTVRRDPADKVMVVYDNLINLPISSYRLRSNQLAFDGAVGTVSETVVTAAGKRTSTSYVFNQQGLLSRHDKVSYSYGFDSSHGFYPKSRTEGGKTYRYTCTYGAVGGRLSRLTCTDGSEWNFTYDQQGHLTGTTEKQGKLTRTCTYRSGKVRTLESTNKLSMKFLRYDDARVTQLDMTKSGKATTLKVDYELDAEGRWTQAVMQKDGKLMLTITRSYAK